MLPAAARKRRTPQATSDELRVRVRSERLDINERREPEMRKVIANEFLSLDGVAQAPGGAEEDTDGGFAHGGWHMQYMDDELAQQWVLGSIVEAGGFLLGRRTYDIFAGFWPTAPEEEQVVAEPLNTKPKYVASRTLAGPPEWQNSTLLEGDVPWRAGSNACTLSGSQTWSGRIHRSNPASTAALVKLAVTRNTPWPASAACNRMSAFELTSRGFSTARS